MAATVIDRYGAELTQVQPPMTGPLKPNQYEGRLRIAFFTIVFTTDASGTDVAVCILPKTARVILGSFWVSASTGTATLSVGLMDKAGSGFIDAALSVSDNVAFFLAAAAVTVTTEQRFANTIALNFGYETEKEVYVTITTGTAAMAGQTLKGYVGYVVD